MNELRRLEKRLGSEAKSTTHMRELTPEEASLVAGGGDPIGFCRLPSTQADYAYLGTSKRGGWSWSAIASFFYS